MIVCATTHKLLCEEHEEYWMHWFYLCLKDSPTLPLGYYQSGSIEPRSAIIVHGFAEWPGGMSDPIDAVDTQKMFIEKPNILNRNYDLRFYLDSFGNNIKPEYET